MGLPFLILAVVFLLYELFGGLIVKLLCKLLGKHKERAQISEDEPTFSKMKDEMAVNHLMSYDIMKNPKYSYLIENAKRSLSANPSSPPSIDI